MIEQKSVRSPSCESEESSETMCDELTATFISLHHWRKETENLRVKLSLKRRKGLGEGVFKIWFCLLLSYSNLIGDKLISQVLPMTIIGESSRCPYLHS